MKASLVCRYIFMDNVLLILMLRMAEHCSNAESAALLPCIDVSIFACSIESVAD